MCKGQKATDRGQHSQCTNDCHGNTKDDGRDDDGKYPSNTIQDGVMDDRYPRQDKGGCQTIVCVCLWKKERVNEREEEEEDTW